MAPTLLSVTEAALAFGYSEEQIRRLIRDELVVATKKGTMWWVDKRSLSAYIASGSKLGDGRRGPKHRNTSTER